MKDTSSRFPKFGISSNLLIHSNQLFLRMLHYLNGNLKSNDSEIQIGILSNMIDNKKYQNQPKTSCNAYYNLTLNPINS